MYLVGDSACKTIVCRCAAPIFFVHESAKTWITVVDTRSGIREDKLILDIAALEEGSRYARLQFLNPDGKVLKSIDIWQSTDFTIKFELISLDEREIRVKSIPTDPDVWYHMGIASAEDFDRYADWHKFVENLISSDGGGLLAVYVGDEEFSTTCTPGTEYVIYGFAYDDLEVRSDISFFRASSLSFSSVSSPSQSNGGKSRRSPSEKRV